MRYQLVWDTVEADTAEEFVRQLAAGSRAPAPDDAQWMREAAARYRLQTGRLLRSGSTQEFVEDLIKEGLVKIIDDGSK